MKAIKQLFAALQYALLASKDKHCASSTFLNKTQANILCFDVSNVNNKVRYGNAIEN